MRPTVRLITIMAGAAFTFAACSGNGSLPSSQNSSSSTRSLNSVSATATPIPPPPYEAIEAPVTPNPSLQTMVQTAPAGSVSTVPLWSDSFTFAGTSYPYFMVGTSPFERPATTTVVPTEIQPLTIVFSDGTSIDGVAPSIALANSPIFNNALFPPSGETSQFVDVMQRANFSSVIGQKYHVLLGTPTILPAITIAVPSKFGKSGLFSFRPIGLVDFGFMFNAIESVIAERQFDPTTLPILTVGNVLEFLSVPTKSFHNCCIAGFHFAQAVGANGILTFVFSAYNSPGIFIDQAQDITFPSHEVAEWANDPVISNVVPPWGFPTNPSVCVNHLLEVGDPLEVFVPSSYPVTLNGTTYHPQDIAFLSWFAHQVPSIAINGQYSYNTSPLRLTAPPAPCS